MKQNITFQALKPFIPPENWQLYAGSLTEDVAKACDSEEGESNPPGEDQEEGQEVMPMSFAACHRSSLDSPQPLSIHTSSPSTAVKCMSGQESSVLGMKSTIKNHSALSTYTPVGDSGQCTCLESCIKMGNTKDPTKSCVERLKLSGAKEPKKEILNLSSPTQKPKIHILDPWKKPYESGQFNKMSGGRC